MIDIDILKKTRENFSLIINQYSLAQLNYIPTGFKNNLLWNYGHIVVTQQLLCYKLSGLEMTIPVNFIEEYKKGTVPSKTYTEADKKEIELLAKETITQFEKDLQSGIFTSYQSYTNTLGVALNTIHDAISFNDFHEGLHLGYIMSMKRFIK